MNFSTIAVGCFDGHLISVRVDCESLEDAIDVANGAQADFQAVVIEPTALAPRTEEIVYDAATE
jgi:hypothetical protein